MRKSLRFAALFVLLCSVGYWWAKGANGGWTVNNIKHETPDPVTGLTGVSWKKGFLPGLDFLAVAALGAGLLAGASFLLNRKKAGT